MSSVIRLVTQLVQRNCLVACRDVSVSYISCTLRTCEAMVGLSVMRLRYWLNYPGVVVRFPTEWSNFFYLFSNHRDTIVLSDVSWTPDLMNIIIVYCAQSLVSVKLKSYVLFFLTRVGYFGQQTICYVTAEPGRFLATVTVSFLQKKCRLLLGGLQALSIMQDLWSCAVLSCKMPLIGLVAICYILYWILVPYLVSFDF